MTLSLREAFDAVADLPTTQRHAIYREHAMGDEEIDQLERLVAANKEPLEVDEPLLDLERVLRKTPLAGSSLGRWRLLDPLGRGGMGVVWRAERTDGRVEQTVAIKLLDQPLDPTLQARIGLERSILARLDHPSIGRFIDAGEDDQGHPYFAMELIDGKAIDQWADERRSSVRERVSMVYQLLEALAHAHAQLVVHRDLKCSNVLVTGTGIPKLIDFGIARNLGNASDTRAYGRFLTLRNAAPEQLLGQAVGTGVDIYGAGLVLYELLCGQHPFSGEYTRSGELEQRILDESPQPPSRAVQRQLRVEPSTARDIAAQRSLPSAAALQSALSGDLDAIVEKALAKTATDRYSTAEAFAADLQSWLNGHPVRVRRSSALYRVRKFVGRHRFSVASASAFVVGLLVLSVFLWNARLAASEARASAEQTVEFLVGVFSSSDPEQNQGSPPTALELLDRAIAQRPQQSLPTRAEAAFSMAIGRTLLGLGEPRRALAILPTKFNGVLGITDQVRLDSLRARATLAAGDSESALAEIRRLLPLASSSGEDELLLQLRRLEVQSLLAMDRRTEAMALANDLLRSLGKATTTMPEWKLKILGETLWVVSGRGDADESQYKALEETLGQMRIRFGERHQEVANLLRRLAQIDRLNGNFERARARFQEVLTIYSSIYGEQHLSTARLYNSLANLDFETENYSAALQEYGQALAVFELRLGREHSLVAMVKMNIGMLLFLTGQSAEALTSLTQAESIASNNWDRNGVNYLTLSLALASAELEMGRLESARVRLEQALVGSRRLDGKNLIAWGQAEQAQLFFRLGQPDTAKALLASALPVMESDRRYFGGFRDRALSLQKRIEAASE